MKSTSAKISITVGALIPVSIVVLGWMFPEDSDERAASEEVQLHQLELKDGLWHHKESGSPHTGKFYELSNSTSLLAEGNLNKGKLHGTYTRWHENGNKLAEKKFEYGKLISEKKSLDTSLEEDPLLLVNFSPEIDENEVSHWKDKAKGIIEKYKKGCLLPYFV